MRVVIASLLLASAVFWSAGVRAADSPTHAHARSVVAKPAPAPRAGAANVVLTPLWQGNGGRALSVTDGDRVAPVIPPAAGGPLAGGAVAAAQAGVQFNATPSLYTRAEVGQENLVARPAGCVAAQPDAKNAACLDGAPLAGVQSGELGAGYANDRVQLDLSIGQSMSRANTLPAAGAAALPRVLPSDAGAAVAAPLWFSNSSSTSLGARGKLRIAPGTKLDLGASVGRVHFLSDPSDVDDLNQTTLSFGLEHGRVSGAIVGRMLEPALPGLSADQNRRWSGIDLGVTVHLPWQGDLSFGAQNLWSSGRQPLSPQDISPEQGRVPYLQYHQEL